MATKEQLEVFFQEEFAGADLVIERVGNRAACIRRTPKVKDLRPGNTVSGPFMMATADTALYVAILGELGLVALAVTTNLNINFLRKPAAGVDILAECVLLKVGKTLIVGEVSLYSVGQKEPIAHAVATYSVPPKGAEK